MEDRPLRELVEDAENFFRQGKEELARGRARSDDVVLREGAEKIFHALTSICEARVRKYGAPTPRDHQSVMVWLETAGERELKMLYEEAFAVLHSAVYYRGLYGYDRMKVDSLVGHIDREVNRVARLIRRRS